MKKILIWVVVLVAVGTAGITALPLAPPNSVLWVGYCKQKAQREFELLYSYFMDIATTCEGPTASRFILEELSPDLARAVDEKNAEFAKLAVKEKDGTLTVQEPEGYENDKWRVVPYHGSLMYQQVFQENAEAPELPSVVTSCSTNGFKFGPSGYEGYCESYANLAVIYRYESSDLGVMRSTPNVLVLSETKNDLFDRLKDMGTLSVRMEELREIAVLDEKTREAAEAEVASSFAADIAADEVENAVAARFSELRCRSWATKFAIPHE